MYYRAIIDIVTQQWWLAPGVGGDWNSLQSNQTCCLIARQLWLEVVIGDDDDAAGEDNDDNDDDGDGDGFAKGNF